MPTVEPSTMTRRKLAELLAEARARTILLVSPLSEKSMRLQPDDAVNPVLLELEQIVRFEQQWLAQDPERADAVTEPLHLTSYDEWFDAMLEVRQRSLDRLECVDDRTPPPSVEHRCRLVLEHEYRRGEAILETLQLQPDYRAPRRTALPRGRRLADPGIMARFPGGTIPIGVPADSPAWPDEQPALHVELEPFWIDVMPVTNGDFITFMAAGGYMTADFWSEEGWEWVRENQVRMPRHWFWDDGAWWTRWMDRATPLDLTCPVACVSCYEAEAFARFVDKRLPTEVEWEAAATWDPETQDRRHYPWGSMPPSPHVANLDQLAFETAEVGAFPGNLSPIGCYGMIGDLWEWTASALTLYAAQPEPPLQALLQEPGPDITILRGGSWATRPGAARVTARKCAPRSARHLFSGFRCAHDA
jgi:iron(II)-dependent oxidoreductase